MEVSAKLDLPELTQADLPYAKFPPGLVVPAAAVEAKVGVRKDDLTIDRLFVKTKAGTLEASGKVLSASSPKPEIDVELAAKLDLPELKGADLPYVKLPAGLVLPAAAVEGKVRLRGGDLDVASLRLKTKWGVVEASGTVKKATSDQPAPDLDVAAKIDLPAFKSSDITLPGFPPDLAVPATRWEAAFSATLDEVKVRNLRLVLGKNELILEGKAGRLRTPAPLYVFLVKCRSFVLEELTQISARTRELKLSGSGFFAVGVTGKPGKAITDGLPVLNGKLLFKDLGVTVAGLKLSDFTGTAAFDEARIEVPNLKGQVEGGALSMDLAVKDYTTSRPFVELTASLSQFDLGKFFAAKASLASAEPKTQASDRETGSKGKLTVGRLTHPNAEVQGLEAQWEVSGIAPDLKKLSGRAKMSSTGGRFNSIGKMAAQSALVKVMVFPLMIFQKLGGIGGLRIFPDFNDISFTELVGDYVFDAGMMTLQDSHLYSDAANVTSVGRIDLPGEKLSLTVTAQVANVAPMDIEVTGTFAQPKTKVKVGKFIKDLFKKG